MAEANNPVEKKRSYGPQTFGKVLAVLDCFSLQEPELTAGEMARRLGLPISTLYRYVGAMEEEGYLERDPATGRYAVGLRIIELAGLALSRLEVRRHGQVELDALADELNINANLGVLYQGDTFHLAYAVRTEVGRLHTVIGRRTPAHCTAMGKAMMAHMDRAKVHALIERHGWRPLTPNSICDFDQLDAELEQIRQQGYALDRGEVRPNGWCVAAPVHGPGGQVVASISVSSTRDRIESEFPQVVKAVCVHADRLSSRLGYVGRTLF